MAETPVIGFDPSTANIFKKKVAFDIHWDELEGKKVNPHVDVPEFCIGGLGFQLEVQSNEEDGEAVHDIWLRMVETSQKIALPDFEIRLAFTYSVVTWKDETRTYDRNDGQTLCAEGCFLLSFSSVSRLEILLEMDFLAVFSYRLQFLIPELATKNGSDCKIVLKDDEDKTVYVNKTIVAMRSPFFEMLFFGDFKEKDEDAIKLSDVKLEDFLEYLCSVYPPPNPPFIMKNVETLLILADRFQNDLLKWSIEKFLMEKADKTSEEARQTLIWADNFNMPQVFRSTLKTISKADLKKLKPKKFTNFARENLKLFVTHLHTLM